MFALDDSPDRFTKLAVVHRGLERIAATSFAEIRDELEVDLKGLQAHSFLGKGPMGAHEPQATQFDGVPPGPPPRGQGPGPSAEGRRRRRLTEVARLRHLLCGLPARALGTPGPSPRARVPLGPFAGRKAARQWQRLARPGR